MQHTATTPQHAATTLHSHCMAIMRSVFLFAFFVFVFLDTGAAVGGYTIQHTTNILQNTATRRKILQQRRNTQERRLELYNILKHTETYCNTLQKIATTLQHTGAAIGGYTTY